MSHPITTEDLAGLAEARGKPDAAALLRWRQPTPAEAAAIEVADEAADDRDAFASELAHAEQMLADLEALLCKDCARKWKEQQ